MQTYFQPISFLYMLAMKHNIAVWQLYSSDSNEIRTHVFSVKSWCPEPLDDRIIKGILISPVAGTGIEPVSSGYEPVQEPLLSNPHYLI